MTRIKIKDVEAWVELQESHGIRNYSSVLHTLRKVYKKLLAEDDNLEFIFPLTFLSKSYRNNLPAFISHLKVKSVLTIYGKIDGQNARIRMGYDKDIPCFGFAKNVTRKLKDPNVFSVDALIETIPESYLANIHHFLNRLSKRLGCPVKRIVLGDTIRFYKPKQKTK